MHLLMPAVDAGQKHVAQPCLKAEGLLDEGVNERGLPILQLLTQRAGHGR